jgi:hypothetical protein
MKKTQLPLDLELPQEEQKNSGLSNEYQQLIANDNTYRSSSDYYTHIEKYGLSPEEYIHALTKQPGLFNGTKSLKYALESNQNTEENNDKVFQALKKKAKRDEGARDVLESIARHGKIPQSLLEDVAKGKDSVIASRHRTDSDEEADSNVFGTLARNESLGEKHLKFLHDKNPASVVGMFDRLPDDMKNSLIKDDKTLGMIPGRHLRNHIEEDQDAPEGEDKKFGAAEARAILNHPSERHRDLSSQDHFDHVLGKLPEIERKAFFDKHLGVEGGERAGGDVPFDDGETTDDNEDNNWNDWNHGEGYDQGMAAKLTSSEHLSDEHAEHIKRHGSFDEKYNLYNNQDVDPKHGVEMFRKWNQDQDSHGYDSEQLQSRLRKDKRNIFDIDEVEDSYWEEHENDIQEAGDDWANESYSIDDYLRDEGINAWKDKDPSDHRGGEDWVDEHLRENHDWKGDNEKSKQNEGRADFDALNKLAEYADRDHLIDLDDFKEHTGMEHPSELGIPYDEKADTIDMDHIHDKLDEFGGPLQVDYANHDNYSINDHPDFDDRYTDAVDEWRTHMDNSGDMPDDYYEDHHDDYYNSTGYQDSRAEGEKDWKESHFKDELLPDLYANSHNDDRFVPEHIRDHLPEYQQLKTNRVNKVGDGANGPFLDNRIKERSREHEYGEDQHAYETVRDHAVANGGSIDVGTMHKIFPNQKEKWKKIFDGKGKLSAAEVDEKISQIPKTKYGISYGKWGSNNMQNINRQDQAIMRLDHSDESLAPIKEDPEMYETFKKVMKTSKSSGHPTKDNTIAWSRVDMSDPKHWMVDELQSDFGKTMTQYLKNEGHHDKAEHIQKISDHHKNWREALLNHIIKEAKKHGVDKVSTHSPESKSVHTGSGTTHSVYNDSYGKVPKSMGFKPVSGDTLPLTDNGKSTFINKGSSDRDAYKHRKAMEHHSATGLAHASLANELGSNPAAQEHKEFGKKHSLLFNQHAERLAQIDPDHDYNGKMMSDISGRPAISDARGVADDAQLSGTFASHENDDLLNKPIQGDKAIGGHTFDINPRLIKHFIEVADTLMKVEVLFVNTLAKNENSDKLLDKIKVLRQYLGYGV